MDVDEARDYRFGWSRIGRGEGGVLLNRVHRRVVVRDFGMPICTASPLAALVGALAGCIEGHRSLLEAGLLHRDVSPSNLMINEDSDNPSWPAFLVDLDYAARTSDWLADDAWKPVGTKPFVAVRVLLRHDHTFMHDLESFFWVLHWICVHCTAPEERRTVESFEEWNHMDSQRLARLKKAYVSDQRDFVSSIERHFTPYCRPLLPWVERLRTVVFPGDHSWDREELRLYDEMTAVLREAKVDLVAKAAAECGRPQL